jgi:Ca-activated chloride channel family protein
MNIHLGKPEWLWLLWLIPALAFFYVYASRAKQKALVRFADPALLPRLTQGLSPARKRLKMGLFLLGVASLVCALCGVQYGYVWEETKRKGVDIVIALDVSDSMLVKDGEGNQGPTRLERAKREIMDFLKILQGDRIGLVAFAGSAFVECPLTLDYAAAEIFLDDINTDLIPIKGTALGEAIRVSAKAFENSPLASKALVLITDGEDNEGEALKAAEEAKTQGVHVFAIGIGRDEGSPIPSPDGGFRKDNEGNIILSKLDETTLQKIAMATGGAYVRSVSGDLDLDKIYKEGIKTTLQDQELGSKRKQHWHDRYQWFVVLALLCFGIEPFIPERLPSLRRGVL